MSKIVLYYLKEGPSEDVNWQVHDRTEFIQLSASAMKPDAMEELFATGGPVLRVSYRDEHGKPGLIKEWLWLETANPETRDQIIEPVLEANFSGGPANRTL